LEGGKIAISLGKVLAATGLMTLSVIALNLGMSSVLDVQARRGAAVVTLIAAAAASMVYLAALRCLRAEEATFVWSLITRRFKRSNNSLYSE
jgi:hypothetical protein